MQQPRLRSWRADQRARRQRDGLSLHETLRRTQQKEPSGLVTISLSLDFLGAGKVDQWLEVVPRVLRAGGNLGFVECLVRADDQPIARGNATFRIFRAGED